jgi:tRNA (guanine37-N1)-methyltransferase
MICGRYEGVDERVAKYVADEEISLGDFILAGGELPAMVVAEAVSRYIPGVLGKYESLEDIKGSFPAYTRPEIFEPKKGKKWRAPKVLLSGHHKKIGKFRDVNPVRSRPPLGGRSHSPEARATSNGVDE